MTYWWEKKIKQLFKKVKASYTGFSVSRTVLRVKLLGRKNKHSNFKTFCMVRWIIQTSFSIREAFIRIWITTIRCKWFHPNVCCRPLFKATWPWLRHGHQLFDGPQLGIPYVHNGAKLFINSHIFNPRLILWDILSNISNYPSKSKIKICKLS